MAKLETYETWTKGKTTSQKLKTEKYWECLLSCNSELFIFQTRIQKFRN